MAKISVDKGKCIGCGLCVSISADCFKMADDGKAEAIAKGRCDGKEAVEACPVQAISVK